MNETPFVPGWYINFQAAVIKQLPRPNDIDEVVAKAWEDNQAALKQNLENCLLPKAYQKEEVSPKSVKRPVEVPLQPTLYKASDTDLDVWIGHAEKFAAKHLGITIDFRKSFAIPAELPWKSVIPVFDPGGMTNRQAIKKVLKELGHDVYEETDVMKYSGSEVSKEPTLYLIENSIRPVKDTMGKSPNDLRQTGKLYLGLRGYALAFALYHFATNEYLDPETFTWFPEDRLSDGSVAGGYWDPGDRRVWFYWYDPDSGYSLRGARVAMPVLLNP